MAGVLTGLGRAMGGGGGGGGAAGDGRCWFEAEELLASMYGFPHLPATGLQSEEHVRQLCEMVARFVRQVQQVRVREGLGSEGRHTGADEWDGPVAHAVTLCM